MKHLKTPFLVAAVAAALISLYGAGSASATVFCKKDFKPCTTSFHWSGEFHGPLVSGSSAGFYNTNLELLAVCEKSTLKGGTANTGSATETVESFILGLTFESCKSAGVAVLELGQLEFHYDTSSNKTLGLLTLEETKLTLNTIAGDCVYSAGAGTEAGTFTGGKPANIGIVATLAKSGGGVFCPGDVTWEASYEITSPTELYIKEK